MIEAAGGFFALFVLLAENGFLPSRLIGIREFRDAQGVNDLKDSYGQEWTYAQRKTLEHACQAAFYIGIVLTQLANVIICKTKRTSVIRHGFRNYRQFLAIAATIGIACCLLYIPGLNTGLGMFPLKFLWWLPALPFAIYIFVYAELIKRLAVRKPNSWMSQAQPMS